MNMKILSTISVVVGVVVVAFSGSAIARHAGFGDSSWMMLAFVVGILLVSQGPVFKLEQQVRDLQQRLDRKLD
jgi:hypothetical protein